MEQLTSAELNDRAREIIKGCIQELSALLGESRIPEASGAFPLTALQQAYFVGEQQTGGRPAPGLYIQEYAFPATAAPDPGRLSEAIATLRRAHPALRIRIAPDGTQNIVPADGEGSLLAVRDLSTLTPDKAAQELRQLRETISADMPPHTVGQPFLLRLVTLPDGAAHLQVALRLTAFDGVTIQLFLSELARCYADPSYRPPPEEMTFRDYVLDQEQRKDSPAHRAASRYWESRLDTLPPAVELPRSPAGEAPSHRETLSGEGPAPLRRSGHRLPGPAWQNFRRHAAEQGVSAGMALFGLYVESLRRWSGGRPGTVTVLSSGRPSGRPGAAHMWGTAATTLLVGYDAAEGSFLDRCRALQERLYADLEGGGEIPGVEVGRALNQRRGETGNPVPVVFSSGLDLVDGVTDGFLLALPGASLVHSAISTPEVLLDHQVYEQGGDLVCNFDHDRSAYPTGMIDDMAAFHHRQLQRLAEDAEEWTRPGPPDLPGDQLAERRRANSTSVDGLGGELHRFPLEHCRERPAAPAVIDGGGTMSYEQVDRLSGALAARLREAGIGRDPASPDLVAVRLPKSAQQAVAALGVLRAGGAYLPLARSWPASRVGTVLERSGAAAVIGTAEEAGDLPAGLPIVTVGSATEEEEASSLPLPDGLDGPLGRRAYVIYTSGSSGTPKGVVIPHGAAANTLRDLAGRLGLTPDDRVLAVSSPAFDLSVFDFFGILGTGGTVVVPPESDVPDPAGWGELCLRHRVTVWNSVPALLLLTLEYLGDRAAELLAPLRVIMLSGDWIPPSLLDRLAQVCPAARVIAMGGATEASIWSNHFWADELPEDWSSVPYGYPLANQTMHVLDKELSHAPVWVPGDLYIGGAGVAEGYLHAPELTAASFTDAPDGTGRLYRTGDRARYRPGGILEFLGREDDQVKVGGHRIELGELETRLAGRPEVAAAVAAVASSADTPYLAAFVTASPGCSPRPAELRAHLAEELPTYMVPAVVRVVDAVPLTSNGKVDRAALLAGLTDPDSHEGDTADRTPAPPRTDGEARLMALWRELLGPRVRGVTDDFFRLGGDSLMAVRLFHRIEAAFGRTLPLASLMRNRTVAQQAAQLSGTGEQPRADSPLVTVKDGPGDEHLVLVHPVGGDVLCYQELVQALDRHPAASRVTVHGLRASAPAGPERQAAGTTAMVAEYAAAVQREVPHGRLHLAGWSMGGTLAVGLAGLLREQGRQVASVTTLDSFTGDPAAGPVPFRERLRGFFSDLARGADVSAFVPEEPATAGRAASLGAVQEALTEAGLLHSPLHEDELVRLFGVYEANSRALEAHEPGRAGDGLLLIRARGTRRGAFPSLVPLEERLADAAGPTWLDGDHYSIVGPEGAAELASLLADRLAETGSRPPGRPGDSTGHLESILWC